MTTDPTPQHDERPRPGTDPARRPLWTRPGLLALVTAVVLAYGSLIPFDFSSSQFAAPRWVDATPGQSSLGIPYALSDAVVNVLLYLPLGVALRMAIRTRIQRSAVEIVGAVMGAFALSWFIESLQGLMPARVASLNDVVANSGGALLAAAAAPWLWAVYKKLAFTCYCRLASAGDRLRRWFDRPGVAIGIAGINALVIGVWYALEVGRSVSGGDFALPFERAFNLPYDIGALLLGQALLAYAGIGCLLLLLTYSGARRLAMNWVVLGVLLVAFAAELSRAVTHGTTPDVTGPLLALAAASIMAVTVYTFSLAVKRANRRHVEHPYDGPERRRRPHDYV